MQNKSKDKGQRQVLQRETSIEQHVWNYPAPPPQVLQKYNEIDPRFADQFLTEWKTEADHRRKCELEALAQRDIEIKAKEYDLRAAHKFDFYSLTISFILILILLGTTIYFGVKGESVQSIISLVTTLALFWYKKNNIKK